MSSPTSHAGHAGEPGMHVAHVSSVKTLVAVLGSLLFLTVITVAVGQFDFGSANLLVAMLIALVKMSLVMTWFMHLRHDTAVNTLFILGSFVFLSLLFLFTLSDRTTRGDTDPMLTMSDKVNPGTYPSSLKPAEPAGSH